MVQDMNLSARAQPTAESLSILITVRSLRQLDGGPAYTVPALSNALALEGIKVTLVTGYNHTTPEVDLNNAPFEVIRLPAACSRISELRDFLTLRNEFEKICKKISPHLIHCNGLWTPLSHAAASSARRHRIPILTAPRGMMSQWSMNNKSFKKKLALALYQQRDLASTSVFHATSTNEMNDIRRTGLKQAVALIPNGIHIPPYSRKSELSDKRVRTVLFLSRLHPQKGLLRLITAWHDISPKGWRCIIAGRDEEGHKGVLISQIKQCGLSDQFSFVDFVQGEEKRKHYRDADIFVLPTQSENFGVAIAEALANGTPVLTTTGAPWQELNTLNCGWWVDNTQQAITDGLRKAMRCSDDTRIQMGIRGRQFVESRYAWSSIGGEMSATLKWMTGMGPVPSCIVLSGADQG
ncbi:MAG: glycosyltransferase [Deltaproteobacteria bacterium]|nr:glycosyltransferase [Deltaproteobacteria bacterium]